MKLIDDLKSDVTLPPGKDLTTYTILGILLGGLGIHNFYAGNTDKAKAQLIFGLVGYCCCCFPTLISCVTAIMDVINVRKSVVPPTATPPPAS